MTSSALEERQPIPGRVAKELVASSGFLLARLGFGFKAKAIAAAEGAGFEIHDYGVLTLVAEGAHQTQATIADALMVDPSRLVALLDSLEERGWIVRQRDPQDRRRHVVSITPEGARKLAELREVIVGIEDAYLGALSPEERKQFHELLLKLACANDPRCAFAATPQP
jgi:DNA-binding MarR family transcriptional regulator